MTRGRWQEDIDKLLEGGLNEATVLGLLHLLVPGEKYDTWPSVELVLYVAEHEVLAPVLRAEEADEKLVEALDRAFTAVSPRLGVRLLGPTWKRAEAARRRLDAEERKFELVAARVADMEPADAQRATTAYYRTMPAPIFADAFKARFPELSRVAAETIVSGSDLEPLGEDRALIEALREVGDGAADTMAAGLQRLADRPDFEQLMQFGLRSNDDDQVLVAAAMATWLDRTEFVAPLLHRVALGEATAPYLAVMAGILSPHVTLHTLGQILVDAALANPEEPGGAMTPHRAAALVSARCVLPLVGSPLASMDEGDFPDDIRAITDLVERAWAAWHEVLER
jgi:hypothetical protein